LHSLIDELQAGIITLHQTILAPCEQPLPVVQRSA
jgi:hypothetical protein